MAKGRRDFVFSGTVSVEPAPGGTTRPLWTAEVTAKLRGLNPPHKATGDGRAPHVALARACRNLAATGVFGKRPPC